jgi:hypothetical protein
MGPNASILALPMVLSKHQNLAGVLICFEDEEIAHFFSVD